MELVELTDGLPSDADACSQAIYLIRKSHELGEDCPKHPPKLQEWCADSSNDAGEVLYNVVAESDGVFEYGLEHVIEWIVRFAESEEWLDVNRDSYQLFYSGNRSVHLHTDRFVVGQKQWEELKKLAEQFCEETGASLDCGIYQSKPQFRSKGAEHHETGLAKVPINDDFSQGDAVAKAASFDGSARLPDTFRPDHLAIKHVDAILNESWDVLPDEVQECVLRPDNRVSDNGDDTVENADNAGSQSDDSIAECVDFWLYRCAEGGDRGSNESPSRSVCLAKMWWDEPVEIGGNCYMPAADITAVGANGTYRKDTSPGIIGLSSRDLQKWDADVGGVLVLIGGHNRSARILNLTGEDKLIAKVRDRLRNSGRASAYGTLEEAGYDIGSAGKNGPRRNNRAGTGKSDARQLKLQVERGEAELNSSTEKGALRVTDHILHITGRQTTLQRGAKGPTTRNIELIDLENIDHNSFITANQVRFRQDGRTIIPDTTLFINGIPIVQGELKSSGQGNQLEDAVRNLLTYEEKVPEAFRTVLFNFAAETHQYAVGAVGATGKHYYPWNRAPPEYATEADIDRFKQGARATLNRPTVRDILKDYVFFEERTDGITKIVPRHMQYYATESLLERVQSGHEEGETTRGLIWHTQGSGKSFTMLYAANRLLEAEWFPSPQVLLLVDTDDLRDQMTATLRNIGLSHRFEVAESMDHLYELIENGMSKIILSTIQMFEEAPTGLQGNENTVILSDESHRFMEKQLGNRLEGALPDAHHYGFTGTPVTDDIRNTFENYSGGDERNGGRAYLDHYSIKDGIDDGVILPVHFEVRTDVTWSIDESRIDKEFEQLTEGMSDNERRQIIREAISSRELSELESRVSALSNDIHEHFQEKLAPNGWKGMVVTPSRDAAKAYGEQLRARFSDVADVQVIISDENDEGIGTDDAGGIVLSDDAQTNAIQDFKQDESPKLLVVCDKLLTGFDAPVLKAMYLDRNLKDHSLLQAIARVNRPASGKNNGLIVDYRGALSNLEDALEYDDEVVEDEIAAEEGELLHHFEEILDECLDMFESDLEVKSKEDITQLVSEVAQDSERYKEKVNQLQNVYESLSPHGGLVEYEDTYRTLNRIRLELESAERAYADGGIVTTREQWGEKTLSLLEDTVDFETVEQEYPTFELDSDVLEEVSDIPDEINVIRVGKGIQQIVERKRQSNPRYKQLSERVKQVLEQWNDDIIDATEALAALEEVQEHAQEIEEQGDNPDLSDAEYAIYLMLTDQYPEEVTDEEQAELIACEIERQFGKKVNRDFLGWKTDPDTQKEMRDAVISALAETNSLELYDHNQFVNNCVQYLVENHN